MNDASLSGRGLAKTARLLARTTGELKSRSQCPLWVISGHAAKSVTVIQKRGRDALKQPHAVPLYWDSGAIAFNAEHHTRFHRGPWPRRLLAGARDSGGKIDCRRLNQFNERFRFVRASAAAFQTEDWQTLVGAAMLMLCSCMPKRRN
jgi:hypothetical protein